MAERYGVTLCVKIRTWDKVVWDNDADDPESDGGE